MYAYLILYQTKQFLDFVHFSSVAMPFLTSVLFFIDADQSDQTPSSHLGRLDYASLSQEILMELLIEHIEKKEKITTEDDTDIESWNGITCNEHGDVMRVNWGFLNIRGKIDLQWLPSTIKYFQISGNSFKGSADFSRLPTKLESVELGGNSLDGAIDLTALPESLVTLTAQYNNFSGSLELTSLPDALKHLYLNNNKFEGYVNFGALPDSLCALNLSGNALLEGRLEENEFIWTENTRIIRVPLE